jgi:hypothetical protein
MDATRVAYKLTIGDLRLLEVRDGMDEIRDKYAPPTMTAGGGF